MELKKKEKTTRQHLIVNTAPQSFEAEQFRSLKTKINFQSKKQKIFSLVVCSALYLEGKTTTAINLSAAFAEEGKKVLLIDGDLRKPSIHHAFNMSNNHGLSNVLATHISFENAVKSSEVHGLHVLTAGPTPKNPVEMLASGALESLMANLKGNYDLVIFDSSPILFVSDGQLLADRCDSSILVINSEKTEKRQALKAKEILDESESKLLGAVLNNYKPALNTNF